MNLTVRSIVAGILAVCWMATPALAEKRVALVIGNSNYTRLQALPNPVNDAKLMAETLRGLGFEVVFAIDADRISIGRAVRKFGRALRAGGKDAVGLFYFAGHGVQVRGVNYLIPLGADIVDEADLEIEAVSAANVLSQMETADNALNLIILDACRNNPFKGRMRAPSRGLARIRAATGSLVAFAAAPGQVASDGDGENSPYTKALVEAIQVPGLAVEQVFKRVRVSVEARTGQRQTPWEASSLRGDFYFAPAKTEQTHVPLPVENDAQREWAAIQNTASRAVLRAFIKRHPDTNQARDAKDRLDELTATAPSEEYADRRKLTLAIQKELKRLGCDPGSIDGVWGTKAGEAMARFNGFAKWNLSTLAPSLRAIEVLKREAQRVCN